MLHYPYKQLLYSIKDAIFRKTFFIFFRMEELVKD